MKKCIHLFLALITLNACNQKTLYDISLNEMSDYNTQFCIVLYDSTSITPEMYLEKYNSFSSELPLLNFVNIDKEENKWYEKLLKPHVLPITCVFNEDTQLLDIIPGNSKESILYIDDVLDKGHFNSEYHYNQRYGEEKRRIIEMYNDLFHYKNKLDTYVEEHMIDIDVPIIPHDLQYPYPFILRMNHYLSLQDTLSAKIFARSALNLLSAENITLYTDDAFIANRVLDENYTDVTAPKIEITPKLFDFAVLDINEVRFKTFIIKNRGEQILKIFGIAASCSCVDLIQENSVFEVFPGEEISVEFKFSPDRKGEIQREIYVFSDSYRQPVSIVSISCNVL